MTAAPPTPRLTDRKREAIVLAAIGEFREHGFNGTSMDRVAAAADVSKRTVYNHFPSKEELFEAILLLMWERSQSPDELAYTAARPLRKQLMELLAQKMRLLNDASFVDLSRVAMADMMHTPERARAITAKLSAKEEGLPRWLRAAQQDGRLRSTMDVPYAAQQLQGMVKAFAFWPQLAMGQPPLTTAQQTQVVGDAVDMFLGFYAAPSQEAKAPANAKRRSTGQAVVGPAAAPAKPAPRRAPAR
ncbi:TetR/AcrR family transcriptional regulator [Acidovorax radicis]|uniref:TetR/AcrR family transcriptional regulator n=1 Tax=Acidovorax radicis TaxID=758826 RepID=UPI001CF854D6|nr:TetR/AcrR family transcriptional regulator [Acidovorax radicis]UCU99275.1 TetR/AcrR family transcriptional regulator [Acidovorax radicis]